MELKLNEAQISKITQSDGLSLIEELHMLSDFGKAMGKKKHVKMVITDLAIPLAKEVLSRLVSSKAVKIVQSLEMSPLLIDNANETQNVKHKIKKQEGGFLSAMMAPMASSLITGCIMLSVQRTLLKEPVAPSLINAIFEKGVRKAVIEKESGIILSLVPLISKAITGRGYNKMDHIDKTFNPYTKIIEYFNYEPRFNV